MKPLYENGQLLDALWKYRPERRIFIENNNERLIITNISYDNDDLILEVEPNDR